MRHRITIKPRVLLSWSLSSIREALALLASHRLDLIEFGHARRRGSSSFKTFPWVLILCRAPQRVDEGAEPLLLLSIASHSSHTDAEHVQGTIFRQSTWCTFF